MRRVVLTYRNEKKAGPYLDALRGAGLEPVRVTPDQAIESLAGMGLVLSGGTDIDPSFYGQERDSFSDPPDRARDELELRLLREALDLDLPALAICRGMQLFNVAHGGALIQHLEGHRIANNGTHEIEIAAGTRLAAIVGPGRHQVNSRHHQAVAVAGASLRVTARAPDGVIEAIERPDLRFAVAVQWHPEDMIGDFPAQSRLFEALRDAL